MFVVYACGKGTDLLITVFAINMKFLGGALLFVVQSAGAVECNPADITLRVQAEVQNFQTNHGPGCDTVTGDLSITPPLGSPPFDHIVDLSGLAGLVAINGELAIEFQEELGNIDGLAGVTTILGGISIFNNAQLEDLDGLSGLSTFSGSVGVTAHPVLNSVAGLSGISGTVENVYLSNNYALTSTGGFSGISQVNGELWIYNNAILDLDGFSALTAVGLDLTVSGNSSLTNLNGLQLVEHVGGNLVIENNDLIKDLNGLSALTSVDGDIRIYDNPDIESIGGLGNVLNFDGHFTLDGARALIAIDLPQNFTTLGGLTLSRNDQLVDLLGINSVTTIHGDFNLGRNESLTTLSQLSNLQQIGGTLQVNGSFLTAIDFPPVLASLGGLRVFQNLLLTDLSGLGNLENITGDVFFGNNTSLGSLVQLSGIQEIGGDLAIENTDFLDVALTGLVDIGGAFRLRQNLEMTSLDGLENLASVGKGIYFHDNRALLNIDAISGVTHVDDEFQYSCGMYPYEGTLGSCDGIRITSNDVLQNVDGLTGITGIQGHVVIEDNPELSQCGAVHVLLNEVDDFLPGPGPGVTGIIPDVRGLVSMTNNHSACPVYQLLTSVLPEFCLPEGILIYQQSVLDDFQANFQSQPGTTCTKIIGSLVFRHPSFFIPDISNFDAMSDVTTVGGSLVMYNLDDLILMGSGLSGLTTIGGQVHIDHNTNLDNLGGFDNLSFIGGTLTIERNANLASLSGFGVLTHLGGNLEIMENDTLSNCNSLVRLIDEIDHELPGPGQAPVPDVGGEIFLLDNPQSCNSVGAILDANVMVKSGFEALP